MSFAILCVACPEVKTVCPTEELPTIIFCTAPIVDPNVPENCPFLKLAGAPLLVATSAGVNCLRNKIACLAKSSPTSEPFVSDWSVSG